MSFFRVIMPNYNNSEWLEKSIGSVNGQTFKDWQLNFVDDMSTDDSWSKAWDITDSNRTCLYNNPHKRWNGGSRNMGLNLPCISEYTLFLDSDDWFHDDNVFQDLHDFIVAHNYPDCIRLPYNVVYDGDNTVNVMLDDSTIERLVSSQFVACWSKCVKSDLVPLFPENTLMEDVVQHIKQCDLIKTLEVFTDRPVYTHNRNNTNSCSIEKNHGLQNRKWGTSMYRYMADLLDLEVEHDYCKRQRDIRAERCLKNIKEDKFIQ